MEFVDRSTKRDLEYQFRLVTGGGMKYIGDNILETALNSLKMNTDYGKTGIYSIDDIRNTVHSLINSGVVKF
jgi:hypothetical protein